MSLHRVHVAIKLNPKIILKRNSQTKLISSLRERTDGTLRNVMERGERETKENEVAMFSRVAASMRECFVYNIRV